MQTTKRTLGISVVVATLAMVAAIGHDGSPAAVEATSHTDATVAMYSGVATGVRSRA